MKQRPRLNRVDPFGDLHSVADRGMFTGNRGCLVDDEGRLVRHHRGQLWITCVTVYKDWRSALDGPGHWTPLFFLDDAVALAAGHRPCGLCRRDDYFSYRAAVERGTGSDQTITASDLNRRLARERLNRGRGLSRGRDRKTWVSRIGELPDGTVIVDGARRPFLLLGEGMFEFGFGGWVNPKPRPGTGEVSVLSPPTSVLALANGFRPLIHDSALT